ncbi:ribonuclease HIII [Spiroplasma endosymbiont of Nephrotoma flavescens]|uniref:ribonuclease HIII n=1 Tax=Spiroplasma endosymbiont of Nephrotoma flavescens TaxID=3066302 RepID=UPI00313BCB72
MATYSLQLSEENKNQVITYYDAYKVPVNNPNIIAKYKYHNITILLYRSLKIVFQGGDEDEVKTQWNKWKPEMILKEQINIIGSDESGVGDFFGPLVVTACYIKEKDLALIKSLKIRDSKVLSTIQINIIAKQLIQQLEYSTIIINNRQYNKLYEIYQNSHILKTIGHHQVIRKLANKVNCKKVIIDQFVNKKKYEEYLKILNVADNDLKLSFTTHAEDKFLAVACAAIISRYFFLKSIKQLEQEYNRIFPLGASTIVDKAIAKIKQDGLEDKAIDFGKLHFINWKKVIK